MRNIKIGTISFLEEKTNHNVIIPVILIAESILSLNLVLFPSKTPVAEKKGTEGQDLISWDIQPNNNNSKNIRQSFSDSNLLSFDHFPTNNTNNTNAILPATPSSMTLSSSSTANGSSNTSSNFSVRSSVSGSNIGTIRDTLTEISSKSASILVTNQEA